MNLNERIEKFRKGVDRFIKGKVKNPQLKENLSKIEVAFEFECYLDVGATTMGYDTVREEHVDLAYVDKSDSYRRWYDVMNEYFINFENQLFHWYETYIFEKHPERWIKQAKKEWFENEQDDENEQPSDEYLKKRARELFMVHLEDDIADDERWIYEDIIENDYEGLGDLEDLVNKADLWQFLRRGYEHDGSEIYSEHEDEVEKEKDYDEHYSDIAERITEVFKTRAVFSTNYHGKNKTDIRSWRVESDSSVSSDEPGEEYVGVEIISPHVPASEALRVLNTFKDEIFDHYSGLTNGNTGCHMNIFTNGIVVDKAKLWTLLDETHELETFKREHSGYAKPHAPHENIDFTYDISLNRLKLALADHLKLDKMRTVRIDQYDFSDGSGRLEFRIPGDDYLEDLFDHTKIALHKFIYLVASASIPEAHQEDYTLKLQRLKGKETEKTYSPITMRSELQYLANKASPFEVFRATYDGSAVKLLQYIDANWAVDNKGTVGAIKPLVVKLLREMVKYGYPSVNPYPAIGKDLNKNGIEVGPFGRSVTILYRYLYSLLFANKGSNYDDRYPAMFMKQLFDLLKNPEEFNEFSQFFKTYVKVGNRIGYLAPDRLNRLFEVYRTIAPYGTPEAKDAKDAVMGLLNGVEKK